MTTPTARKCETFRPMEYLRTRARTTNIPQVPAKGVIGEIKPHNQRGIEAGVKQLRGSKSTGNQQRLLLTYRTVGTTDPSRYEVLMADPRELGDVIRNPVRKKATGEVLPIVTRLPTWYGIGEFHESCAVTSIPYHACPPLLGAQLEKPVRATYETFMRRRHGPSFAVPSKSPRAKGHDVLHEELADFLAELAVQLQAA